MTGTEREAQARAMLEKGDLKFRLHGKKLRGSWVLAKMRSRRPGSKGTEWLLIKHRDDAVERGYEIDAHDGSVLTGRTMEEIAEDKKSAEWGEQKDAASKGRGRSARAAGKIDSACSIGLGRVRRRGEGARKAAMPKAVKPMLATLVDRPLRRMSGCMRSSGMGTGRWRLWKTARRGWYRAIRTI